MADNASTAGLLRIDPQDNVAVAITALEAGWTVAVEGRVIVLIDAAPMGHKVAVEAIAAGQKVLKYGAPIGTATRNIRPGEHVHVHNLRSDYLPGAQ